MSIQIAFTAKKWLMAAVVLLLAACSAEENSTLTGLGWAKFEIEVDDNPMAPCQHEFAITMMTADSAYSHTWPSLADIPYLESFHTGPYRAVAVSGDLEAEGYDCQCYVGAQEFEIREGEYATVPISCSLAQALIGVEIGHGLSAHYPGSAITLHASGHSYVQVDQLKNQAMLLLPDSTYSYITLPDVGINGEAITVAPDFLLKTEASHLYEIKFDVDAEHNLIVSSGSITATMPLNHELFESHGPTVTTQGFSSGTPLMLMEGYPASEPVVMALDAPAGLQSAILTAIGTPEAFDGFPAESDLLKPAPSLLNYGLEIERIGDTGLKVDFTRLLENLSVTANSHVSFMLQGRDRLGRVSEAALLQVEIKSVDLGIISQTPAIIGRDYATVTLALNTSEVEAKDFTVYLTSPSGEILKETPVLNPSIDKANRQITLGFDVGEGNEPVPVRIDYMANEKVQAVIDRKVEPYEISIDAFALSALISINAGDSATTAAIAKMATVWANGNELAVENRSAEKGLIRIVGLQPGTYYNITTKVVEGGWMPQKEVRTEKAEQIPDGDFEDGAELFTYKQLPSGGIYSATSFPVYNMQNYVDISVHWMQKHWASVNAKTFCEAAKRHNTWYMQPSAMLDYQYYTSGAKSVKIQSVGWDLDGEEVPPYMQEAGGYLPYNANVPAVAHRSAGRLFLGAYSFSPSDCSETYYEGISFPSRPSSLNGFYRYVPDETHADDHGMVVVEIINDVDGPQPVTLAHASMELSSSPDFVAFNLPISYSVLGLKATRLKIMFASSRACGSIDEEDANVPVTPHLEQAVDLGSQLWIDNLSFSYSY